MVLLLSVRSWEDMAFREDLLQLASRDDGFHFEIATTRSLPQRPGDYHRRVDAAMMAQVLQHLPATPATVSLSVALNEKFSAVFSFSDLLPGLTKTGASLVSPTVSSTAFCLIAG